MEVGAGLMGEQGAESLRTHIMKLERTQQGVPMEVDAGLMGEQGAEFFHAHIVKLRGHSREWPTKLTCL